MPARHDSQQTLPFGEAEGLRAERKELLGLALLKAKADLHLVQLCLWVFNVTDGGLRGALRKTYAELGVAPWGLCCGRTKVAETVGRARRSGFLLVSETRDRTGDRGANEYAIDWEGVRGLLGRITLAASPVRGSSESRTTPSVARGSRTTPSVIRTHYKEYTSDHLGTTDCLKARMLSGSEVGDDDPAAQRLRIAAALDREGVWEVPELAELREERIAPLEPLDLVRGPFDALAEKHLADVPLMVRWFRRQLGLTWPALGDSQAELVLLLAACLVVRELPAGEVQKSRMAIFVATVSRGLWRKVLRRVPEADGLRKKLLAAWPECLQTADWPGPKASDCRETRRC